MSLSAEKTNNDFASLGAARFLFLAYKHNCSSFCEGLVEIWEDRNSFYLFMELCSGGELYHSISARYGLHASLKERFFKVHGMFFTKIKHNAFLSPCASFLYMQ